MTASLSIDMRYPVEGLEMDFTGTEPAVRVALDRMRDALAAAGLSEDMVGRFEIVMAEALNNVVEHAYAEHASGLVSVALNWSGNGVNCKIVDEGDEMPGHEPPKGRATPVDCPFDALPEGGFGWHLIHTLACEVRYERAHNRNLLVFRVPIEETTTTC
ncbi:MAG: ATP-binding protein [Brevirhabdus sp.]